MTVNRSGRKSATSLNLGGGHITKTEQRVLNQQEDQASVRDFPVPMRRSSAR
jgi:hypothetical protein